MCNGEQQSRFQAIVQSLLSKYFELFIKNFTPDQFELSLFSGSGTLTNLGAAYV